MSSARYVGRVGALAVALGIGAVVAGVPGVAWAGPEGEPEPSDPPGVSAQENPGGSAEDPSGTDVGGGDLGDPGDTGGVGDAGDVEGGGDFAGGMQVGSSGGMITSTNPGSAGAKSEERDRDADPPKKRAAAKQKAFSVAPSLTKTTTHSTEITVAEPGPKVRAQAPALSIDPPKDPGPQIKSSTGSPVDASALTLAAPGLQKQVTARMTAVTKPLAQSPALQLLPFVTLAPTADGKLPGSTESLLLLGFLLAGRQVDKKASIEDESIARTVDSTDTSLMMATTAPLAPAQTKAAASRTARDTKAPTVSLTAPTAGATESGTVPVVVDDAVEPLAEPMARAAAVSPESGGAMAMAAAATEQSTSQILATNTAPTASPSYGSPNQVTGAISGSVNGSDVDPNTTLTYTVTVAPAGGQVGVTGATGAFAYTPTEAARLAAGQTASADFDNFTVSVSDGQAATAVTVSPAVLPAVVSNPTSTTVGNNPVGVAVSPTKTYVVNQGSNTVSVIDRANPNNPPVRINVVSSPTAVAVSPDYSRAYVAGNGGVSVINTGTNKVIKTISTGTGQQLNGVAVSPDGQRVYVTNTATNQVVVLNPTAVTPVVKTIMVGTGTQPTGIAVSKVDGLLYVANSGSNSVSVINPDAATPVLKTITVGTQPSGVVVSADGSRVYVSNTTSNTVTALNPTATNPVVATIAVGVQPRGLGISPDGSVVYAANTDDTVSMINTRTGAVITTPPIGGAPGQHGLAVSPDGRQIYVSDAADRAVRALTVNRGNTAPTPGTPIVGTPDPVTGAVDVRLFFEDTDGDFASHSWVQPASGTVTDGGVGVYIFTPNKAARDLAASTPDPDTATFTITVTDTLNAATSVDVTVPVLPTGDFTAPTVSVTPPAGGAPVKGTVNLTAIANDNPEGSGVAGVQFKLDGANLGSEDTSSDGGWGMSWNTTVATNDTHTLTAVARDAAGNQTTSSQVIVTVDNTAPTVSVTAPTAGASVSGTTVPVTATAADNVGVVGVQFKLDGADLGPEDTSSAGGWGVSWDSIAAGNGTHTLTAVARDAAGNQTTSTPVTVTVIPDVTAPTGVVVSAPSGNLSGTVNLSAVASDNVGVAGVQFLVNGNPVGNEDPAAPYGVSWNTATVENGTYAVTARARDTSGNTTTSTAVNVTVANHAPVVNPTLFSQDPLTGTVTGTVQLSDADGGPLAYTQVGTPVHGALTFNVYSGAYTYTPSQAARIAADQTAGADTDSFSVTASDGTITTTKVVTVPLSPAKLTVDPSSIPVGTGAAGIAFRGSYAVVANQTTGNVTVIDTTTNSVIATLPAGAGATSVATLYNGTYAYVALRDENAVSVINTYAITGDYWIRVGAQPWGIVASPNYQSVYVTNSGSNSVSVIDTLYKNVSATIPVGGSPMGIAVSPDSARVYVANRTSNTVSVIDAGSRTVVATVPVSVNPVGVVVNSAGTRAYISHLNGTVSVLDVAPATPTVIATVSVGAQPYSMALSPDGSLYVVNSNDTMSVIDTGTNTVVRTISVDSTAETGMHFVALDPFGRAYITDAADGVVRLVTGSPSVPTAVPITSTAITVGTNPSLVTVSGNRTYVLNSGSNTISVINSGTKQVINTVPIRAGAVGLTATPTGDRVYVAYYDTVSVIDTATRLVRVDVPIPDLCAGVCYGSTGGLTDLAISPDGDRVYILQQYATDIGPWASVAVIDTSEDTLIYNEFSAYVTDLEFTADGSRLFYTEGDYRFVHVSDFSTGQTPVITVSTPEGGWAVPLAIGIRPDGLRAYVVMDTDLFDYGGPAKYVAVLDTDRSSATYNTQIGHIAVPYGAQDVAISPDSRRLYVTLGDGKTVEVIDTATNSVLGYFTRPGSGPMAVGPDGTLYFTDPATGKTHAVTVGSISV